MANGDVSGPPVMASVLSPCGPLLSRAVRENTAHSGGLWTPATLEKAQAVCRHPSLCSREGKGLHGV